MKYSHKIAVLPLLCLCLSLGACSQDSTEEPIQSAEDLDHVPTGLDALPQVGEYLYLPQVAVDFPSLDGIPVDFDFTTMSSTVSFSMAQMMMYEPEPYWDKTFRIHGSYMYQYIQEFGDVHILLLMDETNCCVGFVEFFLEDGGEYPENGAAMGCIGEYILMTDELMTYSVLSVSDIAF